MPRRLLLPLLLVAAACGPSASCASAPVPSVQMGDVAVPIENFAKIDDGLYRGAQPDAAGFEALRALGVKTIVNLRSAHSDKELCAPHGFDVVEIPMHASLACTPPTDEELRKFFDVVLDPAKRPAYVHCAHGKDRTGTMCAVYRMEVDGWTSDRAFEEMQSYGYHDWYQDFESYVRAYRPRGFKTATK